MESNCGECKKAYSKKCQQSLPCQIHNKFCFQCLQCEQSYVGEFQICFSCGQLCKAQQSFYDIRCNSYLCKKQFKTLDLSKELVILPCGCQQLKQHVVSFMSNHCITCLRTFIQPNINQLRHCRICLQKSKHKKYIVNQSMKNAKAFKQEQIQKSQSFLNKWLTKAKGQKTQQKRSQQQQIRQNEKLIIKILNQDFKKTQQQLHISEFTRIQLKKQILKSQRDKQCLICTLPYTMLRKPMMICMQQHLICQNCFTSQVSLINCPLCSDSIQRDKVRVSRERLRTLELQSIMVQKYQNKRKRYITICNNNFQELRYKYEIKDAELQTINLENQTKEPTPAAKRQPPPSKPQNGRKKLKM